MDKRSKDPQEDPQAIDLPEDVAALYSWANLHGTKYRDFSASRRDYRAQLQHRATEQARDQPLENEQRFEGSASAPALSSAEARQPVIPQHPEELETSPAREPDATQRGSAGAEAPCSPAASQSPDRLTRPSNRPQEANATGAQPPQPIRNALPISSGNAASRTAQAGPSAPLPQARRPQGYSPDEASGVRQIYRGSEDDTSFEPFRQLIPVRRRSQEARLIQSRESSAEPASGGPAALPRPVRSHESGSRIDHNAPTAPASREIRQTAASRVVSPFSQHREEELLLVPAQRRRHQDSFLHTDHGIGEPHPHDRSEDVEVTSTSSPHLTSERAALETNLPPASQPSLATETSGPAWLYTSTRPPRPAGVPSAPVQPSVADTLQHSRERVAARWFALKGVFEHPGQERPEQQPLRQKETRTPILGVFSLAGGVGKTSLVATLGRALSSLGEKVLLTDTTSHGLLPFYFGASELRQGTVRTFSPPSGSTDAPIYLVSYDMNEKLADESAQETLIEDITSSGRGTHRILLDLTVSSGAILRRMARLNPVILVPVSPDMNSVISLQSVEKFFNGVTDADGRPVRVFYLLNQFDASLPLHLDVREVLRRQLADRLLPFVIRRAPAVSEALAEGMTIIDYSPDAAVTADYLNAATWLRSLAAPATAGFRNVRWSER